MPFRVSFFTNQQSGKLAGLSENFWNSSSDKSQMIGTPPTPANPTGTTGLVQQLRAKLNNLKGAQAYIKSARVANLALQRSISNIKFTAAGPHSPTASDPDADYPSTALQIRLTSTGGLTTTQWIRGIPDAVTSQSGTYQPQGVPYYVGVVNQFFAMLSTTSNGWCVRVLDRSKSVSPITAFNYTTGVVMAPGHNITPLNSIVKVRFRGLGFHNPGNGVFKVTVTDANTLTIANWNVPSGTWGITGKNPLVQQQAYVFQPIQSGEVSDTTSHYTGKPTGLLGGRRRRQRT